MAQLASLAKTSFGQMLENTSALKHHGQCAPNGSGIDIELSLDTGTGPLHKSQVLWCTKKKLNWCYVG